MTTSNGVAKNGAGTLRDYQWLLERTSNAQVNGFARTFATMLSDAVGKASQVVSDLDPIDEIDVDAEPDVLEVPVNNSVETFNRVRIDWLTGRARASSRSAVADVTSFSGGG